MGRASSREAARPTCETATAKAATSTVRGLPSGSRTAGKSSAARHRRVPSKLRHVTLACVPSDSKSTASAGRDFTISATSRAGTSAVPASDSSTGTRISVVTSRSVVTRVSPSSPAVISTPVRAGIPGLVDTPRCTVAIASARVSRSHLNFTGHLPGRRKASSCSQTAVAVGPVERVDKASGAQVSAGV